MDESLDTGHSAPSTRLPRKRKDESLDTGHSAPRLPRKRKECPHTVTGSQDFYPVKRVAKYKVIKGHKMKQVEWQPAHSVERSGHWSGWRMKTRADSSVLLSAQDPGAVTVYKKFYFGRCF